MVTDMESTLRLGLKASPLIAVSALRSEQQHLDGAGLRMVSPPIGKTQGF
jgi:hypothetical protein